MEPVIVGERFAVEWDEAAHTVAFKGILRLNGLEEYKPISEFLSTTLNRAALTLDLRGLSFLNSSGIAMLSKFVIELRNRKTIELTLLGTRTVSWQTKSLTNLARLMPSLKLEFV